MSENRFIDHSYQGKVAGDNVYWCRKPPAPLNRWVQCFWQLNVPKGRYAYRSIPDNNVDCIFALNQVEDNFFVLPFHSPAIFEMEGPVSYFGIRFRVLAQHWLSAMPVGEWADAGLADVLGAAVLHGLCEGIEAADNFEARCHRAGVLLLANLSYQGIDRRFANFVQYAYQQTSSSLDLSDKQCAEFGLSARHLRRLSHLYLGLSPRNFTRVLRFQQTLHLMNTSNVSSAWADRYYDQPHFIREFKHLSGLTPYQFVNSSVLYNATDHPSLILRPDKKSIKES